MKMRAMIVVLASCLVSVTGAVERTWVGESGGLWTDAANWDPSGVPGETDVLVFNPTGSLSVRIGDGTSTCKGGGFRFESGNTTFCHYTNGVNTTIYPLYMGNVSNFFYVAEGATVAISNCFRGVSALNKTGRFVKTGEGDLYVRSYAGEIWHSGAGNNVLSGIDFVGGKTFLYGTGNYPLGQIALNICSGATVKCMANYRLRTNQKINIDAGGVLDVNGLPQYADIITGAGVITNLNSNALIAYLTSAPCTFSGRVFGNNGIKINTRPSGISDENWAFIIGASNTLASAQLTLPADATGNVVRFAPGITNFYMFQVNGNSGQKLCLEDVNGDPVRVYSNFNLDAEKLKLSGCGDAFFTTSKSIVYSSIISEMTGVLGIVNSCTLTLGDGTDAGWPGCSSIGGVCAENGCTICLKPGTTPISIDAPIFGTGGIGNFYSDITLGAMNMTNAGMQVQADASLTLRGGCSSFSNYLKLNSRSTLTLTNGAWIVGSWAVPNRSYQTWTDLKRIAPCPDMSTGDNSGLKTSTIRVHDGCLLAMKGKIPHRITVGNGGTLFFLGNTSTDCTTADPAVVKVDGGMLRGGVYLAPYTLTLTPDSDAVEIQAGAGGMILDFDAEEIVNSTSYAKFVLYRGIKSGVAGGTDGGVIRTGAGWMTSYRPFGITGAFDNRDGMIIIPNNSNVTASSDPVFGSGDFRLGNARLQYDDGITSTFTLKLATAAGKAMYYDGASTLRQRGSSARPSQNIEIGPSGAAQGAALVRGGRGAAFFLWNDIVASDPADAGTVTVKGGLSTDVAGRIAKPVFHYVSKPNSSWETTNRHLCFLSCDDDGVLSEFTGETDGLGGGANSVAAVTTTTTLSENASVAALRVNGINGLNAAGSATTSPLTISSGATLSVGDGVNPATVLLNNRNSNYIATIKGEGTIDFGTAEGLVAMNVSAGEALPARIDCTIAGSGGLSVVAPLDGRPHVMSLGGANTYTGGTTVNGARVWPTNAAAFASGAVTLGNGDVAGGGVLMATEGLVVPNAMHIAGRGPINSFDSGSTYGAVLFTASGELSGSMDVYAPARLCARGAGVRGTFSGTVSGDSVQIWRSEGAIVFSGANTYTGGTEVVKSTLALAGNGTAGTGGIVLDVSTLRIENTAAKTIPNRVSGIGTLALAGSGAVTFSSLASEDGRGFTLDVCGGDRELAGSFADIASITNSSSARGVLTVASNGAWFGEVCPNVGIGVAAGVRFRLGADATLPEDARIYLADGATLDLDGAERTVRTVYGNGTVVNGTLNETNPRGGMLLIFR